jgi:hypothetical protein
MLAGCATLPPPAPRAAGAPPASAAAPAPGAPVGTTASGGTIRVNAAAPAVVDSTPSPEALAVLRTIPEPLAPSGEMPARPETSSAMAAGAPQIVPPAAAAAPADSAASASTDSAGVPVPSPTEPLGDRPGSLASAALPDSLTVPPPSAPPGAAAVAPSSAAPVPPDSCWRVQVAAPPEKERADRLAEAARSQLMIAMVVEREGGLYKVRTRDCYTALAADDLRRRAVETGFEGAFRFLRKTR